MWRLSFEIMSITLLLYIVVLSFSAVLTEPDNVPQYVPCQRGWYYFGEKCYKVGGRQLHERLSWDKALEKCRSYGGDLVSIESQEEQDFVRTFLQFDLKAWIWIGLNDIDKEGDFEWSDGTVFNYTNWKPGGGDPYGVRSTDENCVHVWFEPENDVTGTWNDRWCGMTEGYVCEMKANPRKRSPNRMYCSSEGSRGLKWEDSCYHVVTEIKSWQNAEKHYPRKRSPNRMYCSSEGSRGLKWEDSCYHVVTEIKSWQNAEKHYPRKRSPNRMYCSSEGSRGLKWEDSCYHVVTEIKSWQNAEKHCKYYYNGHLVSILDTLEDLFLDYLLANIREELWIGIKIQEQLQQKWTSGWYVSYDGFKKDMHFREGICVARKKSKEWKTVPCTKELSFVCKVSKENPPVLKLPPRGSHCPIQFDGWRDLGGEYCYYFETQKARTFYEALFDCKRKGGNLLSLHSKNETDMIFPFVKYSRIGRSFYIGLIRAFPREEEFAWSDDSALNYVNWFANQPSSENEKCVEAFTYLFETMYQWNDLPCDERRGYICSVKKVLPNSDLLEEDSCKSFCISSDSYLYEVIKQSPDAKELP